MNQDQLLIASVTGVDVQYQIAGPGSRSYAFVIDWHIRLLLAVAWVIVGLLLVNGWSLAFFKSESKPFALMILAPALLIYFLYHPIFELATRGRSPGKRIAGVRIVTRDGDIPSIGALLIRNLFRLVDSMPIFYIVGVITTLVTTQHVRIGDIAAGTLLVLDHDHSKSIAQFDRLAHNQNLDPKTADLIDELLERWKILASDRRKGIAAALLLSIDSQLDKQHLLSLTDDELHKRLTSVVEIRKT